jgi:osmotically inducible lipoprotein OsmB
MLKYVFAVIVALSSAVGLSACGSRAETVGTVGGAAVGAGVGSSVTGGSTIGTIGGAAAGGYVGHELGREYDKRNR